MKQITALLLTVCLILGLAACKKQEKPGATYPEPEVLPCVLRTAELTREEQSMLQTGSQYSHQKVFLFETEEKANAYKLIVYKLENGDWEDVAGGSWSEFAGDSWNSHGVTSGKLLVQFNTFQEEVRVTLLAGRDMTVSLLYPESSVPTDTGNQAEGFLTARTESEWEETIPLAVQVVSHQDRVYAPDLEIWKHPEAYTGQGYEAVYLLALSLRKAPSSDT